MTLATQKLGKNYFCTVADCNVDIDDGYFVNFFQLSSVSNIVFSHGNYRVGGSDFYRHYIYCFSDTGFEGFKAITLKFKAFVCVRKNFIMKQDGHYFL